MFTLDRSSILMVGSTTVVVAPRRVRCALISSEAVIFWEKTPQAICLVKLIRFDRSVWQATSAWLRG